MKSLLHLLLAATLAASCLPVGAAQSAQPSVKILHDVPDDGYTYVGNPVHFGYVLVTSEDRLTTHKQGRIQIYQNGLLLYETSKDGDAAHDYDALNTFQIAFPTAGPYEVIAEVPMSASLVLRDTFRGVVAAPNRTTTATFDVKAPNTAVAGQLVPFEYVLRDAEGAILDHSDVLLEVRRAADGFLVFRTHTHTHNDPQTAQYAFAEPGEYKVRLTGYLAFPTPEAPAFAPVTQWLPITITQAGPSAPTTPRPMELPAPKGDSKMVLLGSIDPQGQSSPYSQFRISTLVYDLGAKAFVPHVNFVAQIVDAIGNVVFYSESLHEYDGNFDIVVQQPRYGAYTLQVAAQRGEWVARLDQKFIVAPAAPPEAPVAAGPVLLSADGLDKLSSGLPQKITFHARTLAGTPAAHSEIEFQLLPVSIESPTYLMNKLHTHLSADFEVQVTFPAEGRYVLLLDAETIHGDPTPAYYWEALGGPLQVGIDVAKGVPLPQSLAVEPGLDPAPVEAPGFEWALLAIALLGVALVRRRA